MQLKWSKKVPTANPINSIKPEQAIGYLSGWVGSCREGLLWSASLGLPTRIFLACQKNRVGSSRQAHREAIVYCSSRRSNWSRSIPVATEQRSSWSIWGRVKLAYRSGLSSVCNRLGVENKSCIRLLVELGRVQSGNLGDREDRVDLIGSGNPPYYSSCHKSNL